MNGLIDCCDSRKTCTGRFVCDDCPTLYLAHASSGGLLHILTKTRPQLRWSCPCCEGLVAVSPGEVLGPDVLVGVLGALLQRGHVRPVLPVLRPQPVGVGAGEGEPGDAGTVVRVG
ncbi:hypothetical protein FJTKL_04515 [Diaporthe vaccinii]|uniref:PHD-type domain-containing protein n=1 Tax=Diaporthe vaccinii TaxID=105482 RepID=A0ABR4DW71_9PEZI